jgi:hypothetical protein
LTQKKNNVFEPFRFYRCPNDLLVAKALKADFPPDTEENGWKAAGFIIMLPNIDIIL